MASHKNLRGLALVATVAALLGTAGSATAGPIIWNLEQVAFNDGGIATGTFTTNNNSVTNWDITTTGGATLPAFTYDTLNSDAYGPLPDVHFITLDNLRYLRLQFAVSLSNPGTDPILTTPIYTSYECGNNPSCSVIREVTGGAADSVPEPGAIVLLGVGLFSVALVRRGRLQVVGGISHLVASLATHSLRARRRTPA